MAIRYHIFCPVWLTATAIKVKDFNATGNFGSQDFDKPNLTADHFFQTRPAVNSDLMMKNRLDK